MPRRLPVAPWLAVCLALGLSACAYDWTIGEPGQGGSGGASTTAGGGQSTTATPADPCEPLLDDLAQKKEAAKACSRPGTACDALEDECGCATNSVKDASSPETAAYLDAIAALRAAGCDPSCPGCSAVQVPFCSPISSMCEP